MTIRIVNVTAANLRRLGLAPEQVCYVGRGGRFHKWPHQTRGETARVLVLGWRGDGGNVSLRVSRGGARSGVVQEG